MLQHRDLEMRAPLCKERIKCKRADVVRDRPPDIVLAGACCHTFFMNVRAPLKCMGR